MKMKLGNSKATPLALDAVKKPGMPTKKLQMNIAEDLHKSFKLACLEEDRDMTEVTIELIEKWLRRPA